MDSTAVAGRTLRFGKGSVGLDDLGCVAAVTHPDGRPMLLTDDPEAVEASMHEPARRWGTGFLIVSEPDGAGRLRSVGHRWHAPAAHRPRPDGCDLEYRLGALRLLVDRTVNDSWRESYRLVNDSPRDVRVGSFAISTPWRDVYGSSRDSLRRAVHAHLWTGGADSWGWAAPMDGSGPGLGLIVTDGELWAYSVESRDLNTSSNVRGHLYLHATDHARSPHTLGGQPQMSLAPGESLQLAWSLDWYDDRAAFARGRRTARPPLIEPESLTATAGTPIDLHPAPGVTTSQVSEPDASGLVLYEAALAGRRTRVALLRHHPLRELAAARVRFALDRQRPVEEPGSRRHAFVPFDTDSGVRVLAGAWRDWNDARERIGTALLLQRVRDLGWTSDALSRSELGDALIGYQQFVTDHLVSSDGTVADDSRHPERVRLYNFPWFARFLLGQGDLHGAVRIIERYYARGGDHFLAFGLGRIVTELADRLDALGGTADAARLRHQLAGHAEAMLAHGDDLPAHEVNYEQSMVAPLLELLIAVRGGDPDAVPGEELVRRLGWLTAFAADQPDARLHQVPIRHWDGFWFGVDRRWGDTFPHYWSVLSAEVFLNWPDDLLDASGRAELREMGAAILRANLGNFRPDGTATCAFVYPSCVNCRPAHVADPLINDQDWALVAATEHLDVVD